MKSILKFGIASVLALTLAAPALAATGDAVFFSISQTDPNAGSGLNLNVGGSAPLYIWVTSSGAASDLTPLSTTHTPGGNPTGAAAIALNGTITGGTATITSGQYYNFDPAVPATSIYAYAGAGTPAVSRWSATTPTVSGTTFTNFEANTAMQSPNGTTFAAGTITGLSRANIDASANADPLYNEGVVVPNGSTGGAGFLGVLNINALSAGPSTLTLTASGLDLTKSGPGGTTVLTSAYTYGTATITGASAGRTGDINLDGNINAADINLMGVRLAAGGLPYDIKYDYRGPTLGSGPDGLISQVDRDRLVGSLIDVNGVQTSVGTHYGDADLTGIVDIADFNTFLANFGATPGTPSWANADFDGSGIIDIADFNTFLANFGASGGTGQIAPVPEPSTFALLALGGLGLFVARRRVA